MGYFALKKTYILLAIFVFANVLTFLMIVNRYRLGSYDFIAYSLGAEMLLDGRGRQLYNLDLQSSYWSKFFDKIGITKKPTYILPYIAPPITALLYIPYQSVPTIVGMQLARAVSMVFFLMGIWVLAKTTHTGLLPLLVVLSSWYVWYCILQTQPTALLFLVTCTLYASLNKKRHLLSGILCSLFILKPQYLVIVPFIYILTHKNSSFVKSFLVSITILVVVNFIISGPGLVSDYFNLLSSTDNPDYGNRWSEMYSVQALVFNLTQTFPTGKLLAVVIGGVFYIWTLLRMDHLSYCNKTVEDLFPVAIMLTILSAYHVLTQDISLGSIAVLLILTNKKYGGNKVWMVVILVFHILSSLFGTTYKGNYVGVFYLIITLSLLYLPSNQKEVKVSAKVN